MVTGCESYEVNVRRPGGFVLPHPPRDSRTFETPSGRGEFVVSPVEVLEVPDGHLLLQTLRSHDQFNTTIYGLDDRYAASTPVVGSCSSPTPTCASWASPTATG